MPSPRRVNRESKAGSVMANTSSQPRSHGVRSLIFDLDRVQSAPPVACSAPRRPPVPPGQEENCARGDGSIQKRALWIDNKGRERDKTTGNPQPGPEILITTGTICGKYHRKLQREFLDWADIIELEDTKCVNDQEPGNQSPEDKPTRGLIQSPGHSDCGSHRQKRMETELSTSRVLLRWRTNCRTTLTSIGST